MGQWFTPVREINASNSAVRVNLQPRCLDVIRAVCSSREIRQIKLNLIPTARQPDRHWCAEGSDASGALEIAHSKPPVHVLVVEYLSERKQCILRFWRDTRCPLPGHRYRTWKEKGEQWKSDLVARRFTVISNVKYFFMFFTIMIRKGSRIPRTFFGFGGEKM